MAVPSEMPAQPDMDVEFGELIMDWDCGLDHPAGKTNKATWSSAQPREGDYYYNDPLQQESMYHDLDFEPYQDLEQIMLESPEMLDFSVGSADVHWSSYSDDSEPPFNDSLGGSSQTPHPLFEDPMIRIPQTNQHHHCLRRPQAQADVDSPSPSTTPSDSPKPKPKNPTRPIIRRAAKSSIQLQPVVFEPSPQSVPARLAIEARYRTNLKDKMAELKEAVPTLKATVNGTSELPDEECPGLKAARNLKKSTVLAKTVEYIRYLEARNTTMKRRLDQIGHTLNSQDL